MKTSPIKNSNDLIGKKVKILYNDDNEIDPGIIEVMEEDGILVKYYTEENDASTTCEEDEEGATKTYTYIPWSSLHCIDYREDEEYP